MFTYDKAKDKLIEINTAIRNRTFNRENFSDAKIVERRFENMMEKWLDQKEEEENGNDLSPEKVRPYRSDNRNYFSFFHGRDVREIDFELLETCKDQLPKKLKLHYRRNILNALHVFFIWMRRKGTIKEVPVWPEIKGNYAKPMVALGREDQVAILDRLPEEHRDVYEYHMQTGLRQGEACALKVKDIDFKNGEALTQRTWSPSKLVETTKGKNKPWIRPLRRGVRDSKKELPGKMGRGLSLYQSVDRAWVQAGMPEKKMADCFWGKRNA